VREEKQPEFVVSDSFEFARFSKVADMSLAQSPFTHLVADIERCCARLREYVDPGHEFYATFWPGDSSGYPCKSSSIKRFQYPPEELAKIGERNGWQPNFIGPGRHRDYA
jgi:hypothetical protein